MHGPRKDTEVNYCLIVSQYYHTRHFFIVDIASLSESDFIASARNLVTALERYKRSTDYDSHKDIDHGDLAEPFVRNTEGFVCSDINVNDAGDIYFRLRKYANRCMYEAMEYRETSIREAKGYKLKHVLSNIEEHHDYEHVKEIVERYFDIA